MVDEFVFKRKKPSGSEYRKRKAAREELIKSQSHALFKYFKSDHKEKGDDSGQGPSCSSSGSHQTSHEIDGLTNSDSKDPFPPIPGKQSPTTPECEYLTCDTAIVEISKDPGKWPEIITNKLRHEIVKKGVSERLPHAYLFPQNNKGRKFSVNYYKRTLCNGETAYRT